MDVSIASIDTLLTSGNERGNILIIKLNEVKTMFEISKAVINENYVKIIVDILAIFDKRLSEGVVLASNNAKVQMISSDIWCNL